MGKTYWMLALSLENFNITRERGFDVQGIDTSSRRRAIRMASEDRVLFYVRDCRKFAATATVTSGHFRDDSRIWKHHRDRETFPHRVKLSPNIVLEEEEYIEAGQIGPSLEYVKKWAPEHWDLAFFGMLHIIPQRDFNLLESEMKRTRNASAETARNGPEKGDGAKQRGSRRSRGRRRRGASNGSGEGE